MNEDDDSDDSDIDISYFGCWNLLFFPFTINQ